jgi:hypothetical protein
MNTPLSGRWVPVVIDASVCAFRVLVRPTLFVPILPSRTLVATNSSAFFPKFQNPPGSPRPSSFLIAGQSLCPLLPGVFEKRREISKTLARAQARLPGRRRDGDAAPASGGEGESLPPVASSAPPCSSRVRLLQLRFCFPVV